MATLDEDDRAAVERHLLGLSREDRAWRFGCALSDDALSNYVRSMSLRGSIGLFLGGRLAGVAHLPALSSDSVELGISVDGLARTRGWGRALLRACLESLHAAGVRRLVVQYDRGNRPMARLMSRLPKQVSHEDADVVAQVRLDDWAQELYAPNGLIEAAV